MNERLRDWILDQIERDLGKSGHRPHNSEDGFFQLRGIIPMDFYRNAQLTDVLIALNSLYSV